MIDLSQMTDVTVDPAARACRCGGGTTWAQLDAATQEHGLAVPGGVISHTGVAGLTLGGGIGWLVRKAGLSCDNLVSAQVVTADGRRRHRVGRTSTRICIWALRGGGGNFGVVTEFEFALHDVGPLVHARPLLLGARPRASRRCASSATTRRSCRPTTAPQLVGAERAAGAVRARGAPLRARASCSLVVGFGIGRGARRGGRSPSAPRFPPSFDFVTPMPYTALQQMLDESAPWGILGYEKALYLDDFSDAAIDVIAEHFPHRSSPMSIMPIFTSPARTTTSPTTPRPGAAAARRSGS